MTGTWQQNAAVSEPVRQRSVSAIQVLFNAINKDGVCMPVNMKQKVSHDIWQIPHTVLSVALMLAAKIAK